MDIPKELKYSESHEWVGVEDNNILCVGITDYVQRRLGAITNIVLPEIGEVVDVGDDVCNIESEKASVDIMVPVAGTIIEINEELLDAPRLLNADPYGDGWILKIKVVDYTDFDQLLSSDEYLELLAEEEEEEDSAE